MSFITGGQDSVYTYIYQLKNNETMCGDKTMTVSKSELMRADITDGKEHGVYQRKEDKLKKAVKHTVKEPEKSFYSIFQY